MVYRLIGSDANHVLKHYHARAKHQCENEALVMERLAQRNVANVRRLVARLLPLALSLLQLLQH